MAALEAIASSGLPCFEGCKGVAKSLTFVTITEVSECDASTPKEAVERLDPWDISGFDHYSELALNAGFEQLNQAFDSGSREVPLSLWPCQLWGARRPMNTLNVGIINFCPAESIFGDEIQAACFEFV
ncbi:MAG: hypothetical protein ACTHLA_13970 [Asticcacaulis sp.]|uniref:hypothetical protein n=1 Tax=Asticcacaulis sp. TaxID=1872648 RepID=UPI003F7C826C